MRDGGVMDVFLAGSPLVTNNKAFALQVAETGPMAPPLDGAGFNRVEIQWAIDGSPAQVTEGKVGGMLAGANVHLPQAMVELNNVVATMVNDVNSLHSTGQGLDTVNDVNLNFFDPAGTTALTVALSADVAGQPSRIALAASGAGALDGSVAQQLAALAGSPTGADAVYQQMVGRIGVATQTAQRRESIQEAMVQAADDARMSVSGVSLDEELTSMVQSQRAYEAAARLLTTVDQMLDTLINRTGVVGR
jgi:flagellar hook-associated protein 1 FlgK